MKWGAAWLNSTVPPLYQAFFDSYAGADFSTSIQQMRAIVDHLAAPLSEAERQVMRQAFVKFCYSHNF